MSLIPVDAEYHYVQDTAPSTANAGDVWLDTSQNPPVAKIHADIGNGLEWLVDQSSDRIAQNLDAPVSEAGQGVDWLSRSVVKFDYPLSNTTAFSGTTSVEITISGAGFINLNNITFNVSQSGSKNFEDGKLELIIDNNNITLEETTGSITLSNFGDTILSGFDIIGFESNIKFAFTATNTQSSSDVTLEVFDNSIGNNNNGDLLVVV